MNKYLVKIYQHENYGNPTLLFEEYFVIANKTSRFDIEQSCLKRLNEFRFDNDALALENFEVTFDVTCLNDESIEVIDLTGSEEQTNE